MGPKSQRAGGSKTFAGIMGAMNEKRARRLQARAVRSIGVPTKLIAVRVSEEELDWLRKTYGENDPPFRLLRKLIVEGVTGEQKWRLQ